MKKTKQLAIGIALLTCLAYGASAQTFNVLYNFSNGHDGAEPEAGLAIDQAGNLYGTTVTGGGSGNDDWGTVFELSRSGSGWVLTPIYNFHGSDGGLPRSGVVIGPDGSLYGATSAGGDLGCPAGEGLGCGTVFKLQPARTASSAASGSWSETVLHQFEGAPLDGDYPKSAVTFDRTGNLFGTTYFGGNGAGDQGVGTVYELSPGAGNWTESVIYNFDYTVPHQPASEVTFDASGNLYGTGISLYPGGGVYQLARSGSGWTENTLYIFGINDVGNAPYGGLILDNAGNLYGATAYGGTGFGGWAYELNPSASGWTASSIYNFPSFATQDNYCYGPQATLTMDNAGNLYGTTCGDGVYNYGSVFKLTRSGEGWVYTSLHDFTGKDDGGYPLGGVVLDSHGNLFGTTSIGGSLGEGHFAYGVVFEITPN